MVMNIYTRFCLDILTSWKVCKQHFIDGVSTDQESLGKISTSTEHLK